MKPIAVGSLADWTVAELQDDPSWTISLDARAQRDLIGAVRKAHDPNKTLLDYSRHDFDFGAGMVPLRTAFAQAMDGRGISLLRGLPRAGVTEKEFELLTWAIGLHVGVAQPNGLAVGIGEMHMTDFGPGAAQRGAQIGLFDVHVKQVAQQLHILGAQRC